jgi:hypothetical protein
MVEEDSKKWWHNPLGLNAMSGVARVYQGIAVFIFGLVFIVIFRDDSDAVMLFGLAILSGIVLILYGSLLVVRYDDDGNRRIPGKDDATVEDPPASYVRGSDQSNVYRFSPMQPDPVPTPAYPTYPSPTYSYPPIATGRPEPGRCAECGGKLFLSRENCPHCGTPVSHLDLNDG